MPHRWGMAVDLDRCTGCGACVTACHAENNIPTVGPEQAARGRAMHWIRVERYWEGEYPDVKLKFRPVMCQQCDAAPGRRDGEMHVLCAADSRCRDRREGGESRAQGRRDSAGMRAVVLRQGA